MALVNGCHAFKHDRQHAEYDAPQQQYVEHASRNRVGLENDLVQPGSPRRMQWLISSNRHPEQSSPLLPLVLRHEMNVPLLGPRVQVWVEGRVLKHLEPGWQRFLAAGLFSSLCEIFAEET